MSYIRKTRDRWDIMTNYGYGWECECSEYTWKEAKQTLKEYRENSDGRFFVRLEKHREKIETEE
jgi:predicted metal-binding protein